MFYKIYLPFILLLGSTLYSCQTGKDESEKQNALSKTQQRLNTLQENYKKEYSSANSAVLKSHVEDEYGRLLQSLLMDTLQQQIDSIKVTVDTAVTNGLAIMTRLNANQIEFEYTLTFNDTTDKKQRAMFNFMNKLRKGMDTTVNFFYMGSCRVNAPTDPNVPAFRIFGFPKPLKLE